MGIELVIAGDKMTVRTFTPQQLYTYIFIAINDSYK